MAQPFLALPKNFRDLILQLPTASEEDAARITIQIQQYLQGEEALRMTDPDWGTKGAQRVQAASAKDKAEEQYAIRGQAWVEDIVQRARSNLPDAEQVDRLKAKGAKMFQEARKVVRGDRASRQLYLDQIIADSPMEEIMVTGNYIMVGGEESMEMVLRPDVIKIRHRTFVLEPGIQMVPAIVAQAYRNMQNGRAEARAREAILKGPAAGRLYDAGEIEEHWNSIDAKYGTERVRFQGG